MACYLGAGVPRGSAEPGWVKVRLTLSGQGLAGKQLGRLGNQRTLTGHSPRRVNGCYQGRISVETKQMARRLSHSVTFVTALMG